MGYKLHSFTFNFNMLKKLYFIFFFILIGEIFAIISANFIKTYRQEVKIKDIEEPINYDNSIYLFGDSYSAGYGVSNEDKISSLLKDINYYNVYDKSKGDYNWINYLDIISDNQNFFKEGDLLVLMVNWNDVLYNQNEFNQFFKNSYKDSSTSKSSKDRKKKFKIKRSKLKKLILKIYSTSKLASFLSSNIQNFVRRNGILLPIGDFYYLSEIAYEQKKSDMEKIFSTLDYVALSKKVDIIIYLHPNYNLLSQPKYFKKFVAAFKDNGFSSLNIIDGVNQFKNKKDGYYCLSIHDGHPNGNAHRVIADTLKNFISAQY
tara:strand:- start:331 stop:1284 length:954 start_codon:yes stop_codon:yes gene_type:complete